VVVYFFVCKNKGLVFLAQYGMKYTVINRDYDKIFDTHGILSLVIKVVWSVLILSVLSLFQGEFSNASQRRGLF
jgi:hypothetical protein